MALKAYDRGVFINCPFDSAYKALFNAIVFAVYDCGFVARCALEEDDGSEVRAHKIYQIISTCRLGIHDLSRVGLDRSSKLPRFNMPLELGAFLGAKYFGRDEQRRKACLILDREKYRYQKFVSDIAGQDIHAHENDPRKAVSIVRNWLRSHSAAPIPIPGGSVIWSRYRTFQAELPPSFRELQLSAKDLIFNDYVWFVSKWLRANDQAAKR